MQVAPLWIHFGPTLFAMEDLRYRLEKHALSANIRDNHIIVKTEGGTELWRSEELPLRDGPRRRVAQREAVLELEREVRRVAEDVFGDDFYVRAAGGLLKHEPNAAVAVVGPRKFLQRVVDARGVGAPPLFVTPLSQLNAASDLRYGRGQRSSAAIVLESGLHTHFRGADMPEHTGLRWSIASHLQEMLHPEMMKRLNSRVAPNRGAGGGGDGDVDGLAEEMGAATLSEGEGGAKGIASRGDGGGGDSNGAGDETCVLTVLGIEVRKHAERKDGDELAEGATEGSTVDTLVKASLNVPGGSRAVGRDCRSAARRVLQDKAGLDEALLAEAGFEMWAESIPFCYSKRPSEPPSHGERVFAVHIHSSIVQPPPRRSWRR